MRKTTNNDRYLKEITILQHIKKHTNSNETFTKGFKSEKVSAAAFPDYIRRGALSKTFSIHIVEIRITLEKNFQ